MNGKDNTGRHFRRKDLLQYGEASNLKMNEHIKELQKQGQKIYHLAFGQSPFPIPEKMQDSLRKHAYHNEYVSVSGR